MVFVKLVPVCELKEEHKALESTLFVTPFIVRLFFSKLTTECFTILCKFERKSTVKLFAFFNMPHAVLRIGSEHTHITHHLRSYEIAIKVCSHLTFAFAFASRSPSKFIIVSMETQTQMHRMGLNPFLTFYIDVDVNANANVKCEHTFNFEMK